MTEPKPSGDAPEPEEPGGSEELAPLELDPMESEETLGRVLFEEDEAPEEDPTEVFSVEALRASRWGVLSVDDALESALGRGTQRVLEAAPEPESEVEAEKTVGQEAVAAGEELGTEGVVAAGEELGTEGVLEAGEELGAEEVVELAPMDAGDDFEGDTELVFEDDEASEDLIGIEVSAEPDRGAMLAATVTSRAGRVDVGGLAFTTDARAELSARAELLIEQSKHMDDPAASAELLALASDMLDVGLGDRARARELAMEALGRSAGCLFASRLIRRFALAEGDFALALDRCEREGEAEMGEVVRGVLSALTGELAAPLDPARAKGVWSELSLRGGALGALHGLFAAALGRDGGEIGAALGTLAACTEGVLSAAVSVARARLAEGAAETEAALSAIREAISGDGTDAGAWLAMARIGLSHASASVFCDALRGLLAAGGAGQAAVAAGGILRALEGVLEENLSPASTGVLEDAGVLGWLMAHASRGGDDAQARASHRIAQERRGERPDQWGALLGEDTGDAGRFHALRAVAASDARWPDAAARFVGGGALRAAGLYARASGVSGGECAAAGENALGVIARGLSAAAKGVSGVSWPEAQGLSGWHQAAWIDEVAHDASGEDVLSNFDALAGAQGVSDGVSVFAARSAAARRGGDGAARALGAEALRASDPSRRAGLLLLASGLWAGEVAGDAPGASDALEAARALPGELAAAEMAGLYAQRGALDPELAAGFLSQSALGMGGLPCGVVSVRAALRRAGSNPEAGDSVWRLWQKSDKDAALGVLVLRGSAALPERAVSVLCAQAERAQGARDLGGSGRAVWLELSGRYELSEIHPEAVQAAARARGLALSDASLSQTEERLWLKAGMFAEVAERAFDEVKSAPSDAQRVAAYERLAELDRSYRGDVASSVLSYEAIVELSPGHMGSLRTLERYFLENGRYDELLGIYERVVQHARDPADAAATAHMAARVASLQAEGDAGAGAEFLKLAMDRGAVDRRMLMALELECRSSGELTRFAEVQRAAMDLATDAQEIATHGCRAGEALLALGRRDEALEVLKRAVQASPAHHTSLLNLAYAQESAGEISAAAATVEALARVLKVPESAVGCYLRAAALWNSLGESPRALAAGLSALSLDGQSVEAFELALGLLGAAGDREGELELIERRTQDADEPGFEVLRARAAELSEDLGELGRAVGHWRGVSRLAPEHDGALRAVARLSVSLEDWAAAADAMVRLSRLVPERRERAEIFFALGGIYDKHLPDARRAEAAWRRVVQIAPDDDRALASLGDLYARTGESAQEAEILEARAALAAPGEARMALLLRLAKVLEEGVKDAPRAERVLEEARLELPTDLGMLRAYAGFYRAQGAVVAEKVLLDRAAADLRPEVDEDPMDVEKMTRLADILELRGSRDGARLVGAVSVSLGAPNDRMRALAPMGAVPGAGAGALNPEAVELLSPPSVFSALREVFSRAGEAIERLMPFDPRGPRAERLGARPHPLRTEVEHWARLLSLGPVEVYLGSQVVAGCMPVSRTPCVVLVNATAMATPATRFAVARAMLLNALSLSPVVRLSASELRLMLNAVLRQFEPMYRAQGVELAELDELGRRVSRALPRDRAAELGPFAYAVLAAGELDLEDLRAGVLELGDRIALLGTGDVVGAIAALSPEGVGAEAAFRGDLHVSRLLRVALSDRFLEARSLAGADAL